MIKKILTANLAALVLLVFPITLTAKKAVAWVVKGYQGCKVVRIENGERKQYDVQENMELYPGDRMFKKNDINSLEFDFLSRYAEVKIENKSSLTIVLNPPIKKESILTEIGIFMGIIKTKFAYLEGASRGELASGGKLVIGIDAIENASFMSDLEIPISGFLKGKTIVFKELRGNDVFRKTFTDDAVLVPGKSGILPGKTYIMEVWIRETLYYRSLARILAKDDEEVVKKSLDKIDTEKGSSDTKIINKAAFLQFLSDLYPDQINLYWLSYHILINADLHDNAAAELCDILIGRCFEFFKGGISEVDFALLDTPGCLVTVEMQRAVKKRFVSPDFLFKKYDLCSFHFQSNFEGHAIVLYENGDQIDLIFPIEDKKYRIESKKNYQSCQYQFDEMPGTETFLFILTKSPVKEMEKFMHTSRVPWKCDAALTSEQEDLLKKISQRAKLEGQKIELKMLGTKGFAKAPEKSFSSFLWFQISQKHY